MKLPASLPFNNYHWILSVFFASIAGKRVDAQEEAPGRIPVYPVPCEYPN